MAVEDAEAERRSVLPEDSGERSRAQKLLEEVAEMLGYGQYPGTMEAVFDRGSDGKPKLTDVYRKDKLRVAELHAYDPAPAT